MHLKVTSGFTQVDCGVAKLTICDQAYFVGHAVGSLDSPTTKCVDKQFYGKAFTKTADNILYSRRNLPGEIKPIVKTLNFTQGAAEIADKLSIKFIRRNQMAGNQNMFALQSADDSRNISFIFKCFGHTVNKNVCDAIQS